MFPSRSSRIGLVLSSTRWGPLVGTYPGERTSRIPPGKSPGARRKSNVAPSPIQVREVPRPYLPGTTGNMNRFPVERGKPRSSHALQSVRETFLKIPSRMRRDMRIPAWYAKEFGIPPILLRTRMRSLTYRQRILATLARMYYIWFTDVSPVYEQVSLSLNDRLRASRGDGMSDLLWQVNRTKHWYSRAARLHGKLKVLLSPISGW